MTALAVLSGSTRAEAIVSPRSLQHNKSVISDFIEVVWRRGDLTALGRFWSPDCINHADPSPMNRGLEALRRYHEQFAEAFAAFTAPRIEIVQQIAEDERVVTQMITHATHTATGKSVSLATIRIDRLEKDRIAEHWSVADMAGLIRQIG